MSALLARKEEDAPQPTWTERNRADVRQIMAIHRFRRPDLSVSEQAFIEKFILPLNVQSDKFGNYYKLIGPREPKILWSCHTDTVHKVSGIQEIAAFGPKGGAYSKKLALSSEEKVSNCLGADDGAGVWMLLELIKARVPGLYVFHRNEEHGCQGSKYILKNHPDVLAGISAAIAFDRRGKKDIITHQCSIRTCSDVFARSLAAGLRMDHKPDDGGVYTDTEVYRTVIPECTNVAAGYDGAHGSGESLDMEYLINLRNAVLNLDLDSLQIDRDPSVVERKSFGYYNRRSWNDGWESDYNKNSYKPSTAAGHIPGSSLVSKEPTTLLDFIKKYPEEVASLMEEWGFDHKNLREFVDASKAGLDTLADAAKPEDKPDDKKGEETDAGEAADAKNALPTQGELDQAQ